MARTSENRADFFMVNRNNNDKVLNPQNENIFNRHENVLIKGCIPDIFVWHSPRQKIYHFDRR